MSAVVVVPCLPVERPHVREAYRALIGQGHVKERLSEAGVAGALWIARALPVVLDVLSGQNLDELQWDPAHVEPVAAAPPHAPLVLVGWRRDDELLVEVLVVPQQALNDATVADSVVVRMAFPFHIHTVKLAPDEDITAEDLKITPVRVRRFSIGKGS